MRSGVAADGDADVLGALGAALLRAGDDIAAALADGYTSAERALATSAGATRQAILGRAPATRHRAIRQASPASCTGSAWSASTPARATSCWSSAPAANRRQWRGRRGAGRGARPPAGPRPGATTVPGVVAGHGRGRHHDRRWPRRRGIRRPCREPVRRGDVVGGDLRVRCPSTGWRLRTPTPSTPCGSCPLVAPPGRIVADRRCGAGTGARGRSAAGGPGRRPLARPARGGRSRWPGADHDAGGVAGLR